MKPLHSTYLALAKEFSKNSKAKRKQVGAILVTSSGVILPGYNGTPAGTCNACEDEEGFTKETVLHAELNCLIKAAKEGVSVQGSSLYVTLSPCLRCSAMLLQAGVKEVFYLEEYRDSSGVLFLRDSGVIVNRITQ